MKSRGFALLAAVAAIAFVGAQFVEPGRDFYHTWQYALALAILGWILIAHGKRMVITSFGALIVIAAGLASGLFGADTVRIVHAPGTIVPLPDLGAAAFFSNADASAIARGEATVVLRRKNHLDVVVTPGSRKFLSATILLLEPRPAAYLEATDARGNRLTITQPSGTSFLSPVLLFRNEQTIAGALHPIDAFMLPALGRSIKAVYFSPDQTAQLHFPHDAGKPILLYDVSETIVVARSRDDVDVGGARMRATLGSYPRLVVASAPHPLALAFGIAVFLAGLASAALFRTPLTPQDSREATARRPLGA